MRWYQFSKTQIISELGTNLETGLSRTEAQARFLKYGPNTLPENEPDSWIKVFVRQFQSPLIYILLVCALIVYFLGEVVDAGIIIVVVVSNAGIGAVQEGKSNKVLRSLKKLTQAEAAVLRDGVEQIIPESEVVVGDILVLSEGQKIAADCRVLVGYNLVLDESAFTGETGGVLKKDQVLSEADLPVSGQHNMAFKGTNILTGNGRAVVTAVGAATELGKISKSLLQPEEEIPLQKNIRLLSRVIIYAIILVSAGLFALGLSAGKGFREMFALVVSLAVSVVPEGLPLVLTVILASGVWRMSKRNALVKKLQAADNPASRPIRTWRLPWGRRQPCNCRFVRSAERLPYWPSSILRPPAASPRWRFLLYPPHRLCPLAHTHRR
ncbi:MAG: HAD-IC family P-type ATPase [Patescibacteria group bacterium]|nr:HAD-IC family P-type ATPase [Patescibacteria group bacterium]